MEAKTVTILMATYNGENYLLEQLESIRQQDYKDWKLVIGDDGSTDGTIEILTKFRESCTHSVEIIEHKPPTGSAKSNFIQLLKKADTSYIMFCDQDDIWEPHKIRVTLECMKGLEKKEGIPILVHTDLAVLGEKGVLSESFFAYQNLPATGDLSSLIIQNCVTGCTVMINKCLQERMLQVRDDRKIIMHDYWAALIAEVYGEIGFVKEHTMYYRQHENNSVGAKASQNPMYLMKRLLQGRKNYKEQMRESMRQIGYFLHVYEKQYPIEAQKRLLLKGYASLLNKNKFYRLWFYTKNKVYKNGFVRILMEYIWG